MAIRQRLRGFRDRHKNSLMAIGLLAGLCLLSGTTHVIREGGKEVGRWVEEDGKDQEEVMELDAAAPSTSVSPVSAAAPAVELFRPRTEWLNNRTGHDQALQQLRKSPGPLVIYFYATWCPHCQSFERKVLYTDPVEQFLKSYVRVRVDGDQEKALMKQYGATGYPTFYVISSSGKKARIRHDLTPDEFISRCRRAGLSG